MSVEPLQAQTRLVVRPVRQVDARGFDVCAADGGPIVARIRQPGGNPLQRVRPPFEIRVGDPPGEVVALAGGAGPVGAFNIAAPGGAALGTIRANRGRWELQQTRAALMVGAERGVAGALRRADAATISGLGLSIVLPLRVTFTADGQQTFVVRRASGLRRQFAVDIAVPWVDRRLALAQVVALARFA